MLLWRFVGQKATGELPDMTSILWFYHVKIGRILLEFRPQ